MTITILLAWIVIALATGSLSNSKGYGHAFGVILGLVFGLIGLLAVAVLPNKSIQQPDDQKINSPEQ